MSGGGFAARLRARLWGRRRATAAKREQKVIDEIASEFTTEELQEFLEGDHAPVQADPAFKEALRQELWELVQRRYGSERDASERRGKG